MKFPPQVLDELSSRAPNVPHQRITRLLHTRLTIIQPAGSRHCQSLPRMTSALMKLPIPGLIIRVLSHQRFRRADVLKTFLWTTARIADALERVIRHMP